MTSEPNISEDILTHVTEIVTRIGNVKDLAPDQDVYDAGVTSIMALPILMELEDRFMVSIPDDVFIAARSPRQFAKLIAELQTKQ